MFFFQCHIKENKSQHESQSLSARNPLARASQSDTPCRQMLSCCMCVFVWVVSSLQFQFYFFHLVLQILAFLVVFHFHKQKSKRIRCLKSCSEKEFQFGSSFRGLICFLCAPLAWSLLHILLDFNSYASPINSFKILTRQVNCLCFTESKLWHNSSQTSW